VFHGSFDLIAAAAVAPGAAAATPDAVTPDAVVPALDGSPSAAADVLGRLVDKSLVVHERAERRWRLLATIRAFALEQLATSGEQQLAEDRYRRWAAGTAAALRSLPPAGQADEGQAGGQRLAGEWRAGFD